MRYPKLCLRNYGMDIRLYAFWVSALPICKEKARKIDKAVDAIRGKFGSDMIQRGSAMDSSARVGRKYKAQMDND